MSLVVWITYTFTMLFLLGIFDFMARNCGGSSCYEGKRECLVCEKMWIKIVLLVSFLLFLFSKFPITFADSVSGKAEIQCRFPAILPSDQVFDICFIHHYFDCLGSFSSYDLARYICVLSGILAHWMGDTIGVLLAALWFIFLCITIVVCLLLAYCV